VTNVKLASSRVESFTKEPPKVTNNADTITYGPYADIEPNKFSELSVHFQSDALFIGVTTLVRELEISHWGNLAVEEHYTVEHKGAKHIGPWSRADYQRAPQAMAHVIKSFKQLLPKAAADIYYRDEIGNISSSHVNLSPRGVEFEIIPRFPLLGGWKTEFYMGYNLPLHQYLSYDAANPSLHVLEAPFLTDFEDAAFDNVEVRIILPEGASNIALSTPFPVDSESRSVHFTYLDTSGRPVIAVTKSNLVSRHNQPFQLSYNFSSIYTWREPIMLIGAFGVFFLTVMAYVRLRVNISKEQPEQD